MRHTNENILFSMTDLQKAILAYRKTYKPGKPGGTMVALAALLGKNRRTMNNWLSGETAPWSPAHPKAGNAKKHENVPDYVQIIQEATEKRTSSPSE